MTSHRWVLLSMAVATAALAQAPDYPPAPPPPPPPPPRQQVLIPDLYEPQHLVSRIGIIMDIGGGLTQFFGNAGMETVRAGPSWTARMELGSREHLGGEVAYIGSAQQLTTLGVDTKALLMSNGFEGLMRWNVLTGPVQPYVGVGIGYKHFGVRNTSVNTSDVLTDENVAHVPAAVGMQFRAAGLVLDGRFGIAAPINSVLIPGSHATSWDIGAKVGYEF